jgi:hypothetical protein
MDDQRTDREGGDNLEFSPDCFVTATYDVGEAHKKVRWMLRRKEIVPTGHYGLGEMQFSGWLFMTGNEEGKEAASVGIYYLKNIIEHDPDIIPYLTTPSPCRLERDGDLPVFLDVIDQFDSQNN